MSFDLFVCMVEHNLRISSILTFFFDVVDVVDVIDVIDLIQVLKWRFRRVGWGWLCPSRLK